MNGSSYRTDLGGGPKGGDPVVALVIDYPSNLLSISKQEASLKLQHLLHDCQKELPLDADTSWSCLDWSKITLNDTSGSNGGSLQQQTSSPSPEPSSCQVNVKAFTGLSFMPHTSAEQDTLCLFASGIKECLSKVFTVKNPQEIFVEIFRNGVERYPKEMTS